MNWSSAWLTSSAWVQMIACGPPAGGGIVGYHLGQLDQGHGISGRLGEHLRPGPTVGRAA
jgi:hypothetical protein